MTENLSDVNAIPSRPLDEEEQTEKLQRMGLDFLSSIHWIVILVVALLFAGLVVLLKRRQQADRDAQLVEANELVEQGNRDLDARYFLPDGTLNQQHFYVPEIHSDREEFASDETNQKINSIQSQKLLPQIRRMVKSGKLFTFFNSVASAKDNIEETIAKRRGPVVLNENQKLANSLRSKFGGDRLRNPLIDFQIKEELDARQKMNEDMPAVEAEALQNIGNCEKPILKLNDNQIDTLETAFG